MGEDASEFAVLGKAGQAELFYVDNGMAVDSVRLLAVELKKMGLESFRHHLHDEDNDFSKWIRNVFDDDILAEKVRVCNDKDEMARIIEKHTVTLEDQELERFGVHLPTADLETLEKYIEKQLTKGRDEESIKDALLKKQWSRKIVSLVLIGKNNPYKEYESITGIMDIDAFSEKLKSLKYHIIEAVMQGKSVNEIKTFLKHSGWHEEIIDFVFYDVFKPHPNIKKLDKFIKNQIMEKNKTVDEVKESLIRLGWKEYIIDSIIYGINNPTNSLKKVLSHLEEFGGVEDEEQIKTFLLQMGWEESDVNEALRQERIEKVKNELVSTFNIDDGAAIKLDSKVINDSIVSLSKDGKDEFKKLLHDEGYDKMSRSGFINSEGELHLREEYLYYYSNEDIKTVEGLEDKTIGSVYYAKDEKPLLIEAHDYYLVLPKVIKRDCVVCNKEFPINKLKSLEMWDEKRTHKVIKYVCKDHQDEIESFLEQRRIVQE